MAVKFSAHHLLVVIVLLICVLAGTNLYSYHATTSTSTIDPSILAIELNKKVTQLQSILNSTATPVSSIPDHRSGQPVPSPANTSNTVLSTPLQSWKSTLLSKTACLRAGQGDRNQFVAFINVIGMLFFHHARKAAGTTLRNILTSIARKHRIKLLESEGITLQTSAITSTPALLSVTLLRQPIARIISLYWYEHVAWYHDVKKDMKQVSTMLQWVNAWRDGSEWKNAFLAQNPNSVYVEVENYFIKSLIGWRAGQPPINEEDVQRAFDILQQFDLIFLSEMMNNSTQMDVLKQLFDVKLPTSFKANVANIATRQKLRATLAKEEEEVLTILKEINKYDIMLYDRAEALVMQRLHSLQTSRSLTGNKQMSRISRYSAHLSDKHQKGEKQHSGKFDKSQCPSDKNLSPVIMKQVGIFRPPKHKGPTKQ